MSHTLSVQTYVGWDPSSLPRWRAFCLRHSFTNPLKSLLSSILCAGLWVIPCLPTSGHAPHKWPRRRWEKPTLMFYDISHVAFRFSRRSASFYTVESLLWACEILTRCFYARCIHDCGVNICYGFISTVIKSLIKCEANIELNRPMFQHWWLSKICTILFTNEQSPCL